MAYASWRDILNFNPVPGGQTSDAIASVTTLTPPAGSHATKLLIQAVGGPFRMTFDGTDPVAGSVGFIIVEDNPMIVSLQGNTIFKFLSDSGTLEYCWGL